MHKNISYVRDFMFGAKKKKIRRKFAKFQGLVSQEWLGLLLSNLVCKVLYMKVELGGIAIFENGTVLK